MNEDMNVSIVTPCREEPKIERHIESVYDSLGELCDLSMVVAVNDSSADYVRHVTQLEDSYPGLKVLSMNVPFAQAYFMAYQYALEEQNPEALIEIDAGGSFPTEYLPMFLEHFQNGTKVVMSSRFSGGGEHHHPFMRRIVSLSGTWAANFLLPIGSYKADMTSGLTGVSSDVARTIFNNYSPDEFISVQEDLGHFGSTEWRAYAIYALGTIDSDEKSEDDVAFVPIVMGRGKERKPRNLPIGYVLKSFMALVPLRARAKTF